MPLDLQDLTDLGGADNTPGLQGVAYFAPLKAFADGGIKEPGEDGVTIATPHEFKPGEGFSEIYVTLDSNQFNLATTGERDSRGKSVGGEFFHPGNTKAAAQFDRVTKNQSGILLVKTPDGVVLQAGTKGLPVEISGTYGSGQLSSGRRGWTFAIAGYQNGMMFYEGAIALKRDAVVGG
ncbi:hypothetical protein [Pontibacter sp. SGAir0037]|uniref:hypothetical protein n=1 Tax=Pontibacter sp. SGAir0037 TaxID=2571030 RepID=UPI0010CCDD75|nr:hypothetical protein [Pontibacter sp. SGAir0037]QCR23084.1 hypothetical protein C1N53_12500 [Pontibacter sp. SGAir0037]